MDAILRRCVIKAMQINDWKKHIKKTVLNSQSETNYFKIWKESRTLMVAQNAARFLRLLLVILFLKLSFLALQSSNFYFNSDHDPIASLSLTINVIFKKWNFKILKNSNKS